MSTTTTYLVDGMTCGHCVTAVTNELREVPGVVAVDVDLHTGGSSPVIVTSDAPLELAAVTAAITEAGYVLTPNRSLL